MRKFVLFCAVILVIIGCSTKKDAAMNRFYHQTTSKFNLADALLKEGKDSLATEPLTKAFATEKSAYKRGRYAHLLGQLYEDLNYADSAIVAYQYVLDLKRRLPRELWIHARLAQLKNKPPKDEETLKAYKRLYHFFFCLIPQRLIQQYFAYSYNLISPIKEFAFLVLIISEKIFCSLI